MEINHVHCENFYPDEALFELNKVTDEMEFYSKDYYEESDIKFIHPSLEYVFKEILSNNCYIDKRKSGNFRRTQNCLIHFDSFDNLNEWSFIVALEDMTFNFMTHKSGAYSAKQTIDLDFKNFINWNYTSNIQLKKNHGLFYRPWLFHSMNQATIHYFKINMY